MIWARKTKKLKVIKNVSNLVFLSCWINYSWLTVCNTFLLFKTFCFAKWFMNQYILFTNNFVRNKTKHVDFPKDNQTFCADELILILFLHLQYELIYQVFGRKNFGKITANLDLFLRRFNEVQFWVVTEMVLAHNVSKRVQLLKKFIKLAAQ